MCILFQTAEAKTYADSIYSYSSLAYTQCECIVNPATPLEGSVLWLSRKLELDGDQNRTVAARFNFHEFHFEPEQRQIRI